MLSELFTALSRSHGQDAAFKLCRTMLEKPKLTLRANTLKTTRVELMKVLEKEYGYKNQRTRFAPNGIRLLEQPKDSLFLTPEFKRGHFEI